MKKPPTGVPVTSVVIVNYNTRELLRACLQSVRKQNVSVEIIVVDNASKDGSAAMVQQVFPEVTLIANPDNRGFAAANNQGFAIATGEYVLMLNSDTEITNPNSVSRLTEYLETHPEVGIVAPRLRNAESVIQQSAAWHTPNLLTLFLEYSLLNRVLYRLWPTKRYPGKVLLSLEELKSSQTVADLLGACLLFRKALLDELGWLDEQFFIFLEETDFNRRARQAGYELRYWPEVEVMHRWGSSIDTGSSLKSRYGLYYPSLYNYLMKHEGLPYAAIAYAEAVLISGISLVLLLFGWIFGSAAALVGRPALRQSVLNQLSVVSGIVAWHFGRR